MQLPQIGRYALGQLGPNIIEELISKACFAYHFDGYTDFLDRFLERIGVKRFAMYLHDFGSQIGLRLAIKRPERIAALIIQNGDIYEDVLGPKYEPLKEFWRNPTPERRAKLAQAVTEEGFKENLAWFPKYQAYLRKHRPPTLIVWGPQDGYMPESSARAYLRDLPDAELHLLDGGHWALETNLDEIVNLTRDFLGRVHS